MKSIKFDLHKLMMILSIALISFIVQTNTVKYTGSDPHLTLLTSQAIIEKGIVNLESYRISVPEKDFGEEKWQYYRNIEKKETFYYYPAGTPILSVPFVLVAKLAGMNMLNTEDDAKLQLIIANFICIVLFFLLFSISISFFNKWTSLVLTLFLFLGTSLISAMGTALWSFGFEMIFILLAIKEIIKAEKGNKPGIILIAIYLALAWVCRPSALSFIAVAGLWVLIKHRKLLWKYFVGTAIVLVPFFLFTYASYGQIIPFYYNPFYWKHIFLGTFYFNVLMYVLFSPMRGLFTFTPILLLAFSGVLYKQLRTNTLYILLSFHFVFHTLMLINQPDWYGGWCFGPRLYTDNIPSLIIMIFMVIKQWQPMSLFKKTAVSLLLICGILIHTIQGMYNKNVHEWNSNPDVSAGLAYLCWNWSFPQFLATEKSNKMKGDIYNLRHDIDLLISKLPNNATLLFGQPDNNIKEYLNLWNSEHSTFTTNDIYNTIADIKSNNKKEFWFPLSLLNEVKQDNSCIIIYPEKNNSNGKLFKAIIKT